MVKEKVVTDLMNPPNSSSAPRNTQKGEKEAEGDKTARYEPHPPVHLTLPSFTRKEHPIPFLIFFFCFSQVQYPLIHIFVIELIDQSLKLYLLWI